MRNIGMLQSTLICSFLVALVGVAAAGASDDSEAEAKKIAVALAKLPEADRAAAEAQRWCAVMDDNRLGSMGTPVKVTANGKAVFLCCAACKAKATTNGPATLAKAAELKKVTAAMAKLGDEDQCCSRGPTLLCGDGKEPPWNDGECRSRQVLAVSRCSSVARRVECCRLTRKPLLRR